MCSCIKRRRGGENEIEAFKCYSLRSLLLLMPRAVCEGLEWRVVYTLDVRCPQLPLKNPS